MIKSNLKPYTIRMSDQDIELMNELFELSGASSKGEFIRRMCEKWNADEPEQLVKTEFIDRQLQTNEILLNLSPAHLFALRGTVTSFANFAERQNEIIDSLKGNKPWMYSGNLFDAEFQNLFIRNIPIKKETTEADREAAIKHNMTAFLINAFLVNFLDGKIKETGLTVNALREFIVKNTPKLAPKPPIKPNENGTNNPAEIA
jgi:hypothetical protein